MKKKLGDLTIREKHLLCETYYYTGKNICENCPYDDPELLCLLMADRLEDLEREIEVPG